MNAAAPRLRMFAGPNGSGKSTIKEVLPSQWLGVYINADEIEKTVRADSCLNLAAFEVKTDTQELQAFLQASVSRVKYRVQVGGHPVAEDKIRSRYVRSLELLPQAVAYADRAYIFDNSGAERVWVAEVTDGLEIEMKTDEMPAWFKVALWDQFE